MNLILELPWPLYEFDPINSLDKQRLVKLKTK